MVFQSTRVSGVAFEQETGWELKPEGACRGEICVPLGDAAPREGQVELSAIAARLGMPIARHGDDLIALGPATLSGRALVTANAPELTLPDWKGNTFRLSSLRGQKVVLVAWAPY